MVHLDNDWDGILAPEFQSGYYKKIRYWLKKEYAEQTIYPPMEDIFNALRYTPYRKSRAARAGSLSRPRAGARAVLFGSGRR